MTETNNIWLIKIFTDTVGVDANNTNIDVEVVFDSGNRYGATFFTLQNVQHLMEQFAATGECKNGLYFWASNMIIVHQITEATIEETVEHLISIGEFYSAFQALSDE